MKPTPKRILMLKSHSAGIGDLLRSSAAWRVLKEAYPGVELHLLFFTLEPGYPSEALMREHKLLSSFEAIDKRTKSLSDWRRFFTELNATARRVNPDLVIDFETNGVRLALSSLWIRLRFGCRTVGVGDFFGRGIFYSKASPSRRTFVAISGLSWPMPYVEHDFVALAALGLERDGTAIEMDETAKGAEVRRNLSREHGIPETSRIFGINIGCATPGAEGRRPNFEVLSELLCGLEGVGEFQVVLTGAKFEREVNQEFIRVHARKSAARIIDLAGTTDISGVTGIMKASSLFISSDSGPYHMAVALRVPTLALFNFPHPVAYHEQPWVRCCVAESVERVPEALKNARELLGIP